MIYPWHQSVWNRLTQAERNWHHALLINGQTGIGKREFAITLCQKLICEDTPVTGALPCNQCQNCRLFVAGTHPDFHVLTSESEVADSRVPVLTQYCDRYLDGPERQKKTKYSKIISVDQIRQLIARFTTHSHIAKTKVALILPADSMNINAANALLKLLEEPPADSIIVLVTANPSYLPPTVRSRCVIQMLDTPETLTALSWLKDYVPEQDCEIALTLANGGPLEAKRLHESEFLAQQNDNITGLAGVAAGQVSPVDVARQLNKMEFEFLLIWLQRFVIELIRFRVVNIEPYWTKKTDINIPNLSVQRLYGLYDRISYYRRFGRQSVNEQLAIEDLVLAFQRTTG